MRRRFALWSLGFLLLPMGATAQEPGLEGRTDIVLQDGFESDTWFEQWGLREPPRNASRGSDGPFRGSSVLRIELPMGSHYGTSFGFNFGDMGMEEPDEVYFRYAMRLGPSWRIEGGGGGKLPGFGGTYDVAGWGGRPSNGENGWSARMLFWTPDSGADVGRSRLGYYAYHADMADTYGDNWYWSGGSIGGEGVAERGTWYQIECYVRNNSLDENDGILRGWVDGTMVYEKTDIRFRDVERLHVERVWFDLYYGGGRTAPADMYVDFDNVVIAFGYIGPVRDAPVERDGGVSEDAGPANEDMGPANEDAGSPPISGTDAGPGTGASGGCGCGTAGQATSEPWPALALLMMCVLAGRTTRRRRSGSQ